MLRLRMVALPSAFAALLIGVPLAEAQNTPATTPEPATPETPVPEQSTPYQTAPEGSTSTETTNRPTDSTQAPTSPNIQISPQQVNVQPTPPPAAPVIEERPVNVTVLNPPPRRDFAVSLGGGVADFTDGTVRDRTGVSGTYEARLSLGLSSPIGFEAAYVGSAAEIDTLGLDNSAVLISNGAEGVARVNIGTFQVQPYVVGGVGWVRYNVVNDSFNSSDVRDSDNVMSVPVGGGLSTYIPNTSVMVDGRFTYRWMFDDELVRPSPSNSDGSELDNWSASIRLGYTF